MYIDYVPLTSCVLVIKALYYWWDWQVKRHLYQPLGSATNRAAKHTSLRHVEIKTSVNKVALTLACRRNNARLISSRSLTYFRLKLLFFYYCELHKHSSMSNS